MANDFCNEKLANFGRSRTQGLQPNCDKGNYDLFI